MIKFPGHAWCAAAAALHMLLAGGAYGEIRIGQTTGITGPVAAPVKDINIGAKLYLDFVNAEGGIGGQRIQLVSMDDQNKVPLAVENATKLVADESIVALFLTRGTPHTLAILPLLASSRTPLIAPSTGAIALHTPVNPWVFNVRASYQREAERVTRHLGLPGLEKVALIYANDSFGADAVEGALKVFKEAGKTPALAQAVDRDNPDYAAIIPKLVESKPLGVLIIASSSSVIAGVQALRNAGSQATVATLSHNAAAGFVTGLGVYGKGVIVSQVFPSERRLAVPMIAEAARLAKAQETGPLTPAMIEGFAAAKVLVAALKRAEKENRTITRASLKRALETLNRLDIGGLEVSFSPTDHTGLDFADLSIISEGGFRR
jgi:branched-chain amino acid transport system substrate-binding protein